MLRKTLTILSLIGLLISVGLWGVSYFNLGYITQSSYGLGLSKGSVMLGWPGDPPGWHYKGYHDLETLWLPVLAGGPRNRWIEIPLWMPAAVFSSAFCFSYFPTDRRKRKRLGLCAKCGYDLRASKDRCPECGAGFSN